MNVSICQLFFCGLILCFFCTGCEDPFVGEIEVISRTESPGKFHDAVVIEVDVGATSDIATWIVVVTPGSSEFVKKNAAFIGSGKKIIRVHWEKETLVIHHDFRSDDVFLTKAEVNNCNIRFE